MSPRGARRDLKTRAPERQHTSRASPTTSRQKTQSATIWLPFLACGLFASQYFRPTGSPEWRILMSAIPCENLRGGTDCETQHRGPEDALIKYPANAYVG
jgi:hypothetical protein